MKYFERKFARIRPLLLVLIAGCLLACTVDLPTPVVVQKDATVAFPCQDRPCGCANADQCWASCCCHSDAEKLAWANSNNVRPPAWFLSKIEATKTTDLCVDAKPSGCCCCDKTPAPVHETEPAPPTRDVRVTVRQQRGCQGQWDLLKKQILLTLDVPKTQPTEPFARLGVCRTFSIEPVVLDLLTPPPKSLITARS